MTEASLQHQMSIEHLLHASILSDALYTFSPLALTTNLRGSYFCLHLTTEENEIQRMQVTCLHKATQPAQI